MKKVTARVITISSQLLVVSLFLLVLFSKKDNDNRILIAENNNFEKMADRTLDLFRKEELMVISDDVFVVAKFEGEEEAQEDEVILENLGEDEEEEVPTDFSNIPSIEVHTGNLTGYGADCDGCSGITASGFDLTNSMYYDDYEYGTIRILAADEMFPFYSIFRITVPDMEPFIGIVLDRGSNVGYGRGTLFDLAYIEESDPDLIPLTRNVKFELLRRGN